MGSKIAGVVFLFFTVWGMASVIELQYWRNADTYPVWLTKHLRISPENNDKSLIRIIDRILRDKSLFQIEKWLHL